MSHKSVISIKQTFLKVALCDIRKTQEKKMSLNLNTGISIGPKPLSIYEIRIIKISYNNTMLAFTQDIESKLVNDLFKKIGRETIQQIVQRVNEEMIALDLGLNSIGFDLSQHKSMINARKRARIAIDQLNWLSLTYYTRIKYKLKKSPTMLKTSIILMIANGLSSALEFKQSFLGNI